MSANTVFSSSRDTHLHILVVVRGRFTQTATRRPRSQPASAASPPARPPPRPPRALTQGAQPCPRRARWRRATWRSGRRAALAARGWARVRRRGTPCLLRLGRSLRRWAPPPPDSAAPSAPAAPCRGPQRGAGRRGRTCSGGGTGARGRVRGRAALGGALLFELKLAVLDSRQPPRLVPLALGEPCLRLDERRCSRRSVGRWEGLRLLVSANPSRDGQLAERRPALRPRPDSPDEGGRSPAEQGCGWVRASPVRERRASGEAHVRRCSSLARVV